MCCSCAVPWNCARLLGTLIWRVRVAQAVVDELRQALAAQQVAPPAAAAAQAGAEQAVRPAAPARRVTWA